VNLLDLVKRKDRAVLEVGAGVEPIVHRAGLDLDALAADPGR
jgi:hypothetical protein